jgi:hypothetical protein
MFDAITVLSFFFFATLVDSQEKPTSLGDFDGGIYDDVNTYSDFLGLDDGPLSISTDLADETKTWLISDSNTDLWADVSNECLSENALPTNGIQRRNDACLNKPNKHSDPSLSTFPGIGTRTAVTLTSEDHHICQTLDLYDARYYAVCDSGREVDRILNSRTGEWSVFHCERRKLRCSSREFTSSICSYQAIIETHGADQRSQSVCSISSFVPTLGGCIVVHFISWETPMKFVFKSHFEGMGYLNISQGDYATSCQELLHNGTGP